MADIKGEDYEMIPHREILRLKDEIEKIKRNPLEHTPTDLLSGIKLLNESINSLIDVFKEAAKKVEETSPKEEEKHSEIQDRLSKLEDQNKDIAKALISFGENMGSIKRNFDSLEDSMSKLASKVDEISSRPPARTPAPNMPPRFQMNPQPSFSQPRQNPMPPQMNNDFDFSKDMSNNISSGPSPMGPPGMPPQGFNPSSAPKPINDGIAPHLPPQMPPPPPRQGESQNKGPEPLNLFRNPLKK